MKKIHRGCQRGKIPLTTKRKTTKNKYMAKKKVHHKSKARRASSARPRQSIFVIIRSWMLLVMFALMLGLGAVVGTYLNQKTLETTPAVAGVQTEAR
jgi:hypothetical protein